jgi:hypothetical protein
VAWATPVILTLTAEGAAAVPCRATGGGRSCGGSCTQLGQTCQDIDPGDTVTCQCV